MSHKEEIYIDSDEQELTKITFSNGDIWHTNKHGKFHRLDEPAVIRSDGSEFWYKDGLLHRLDGPAVIWYDGTEKYWLGGKEFSKRDIDILWLKKQVGK